MIEDWYVIIYHFNHIVNGKVSKYIRAFRVRLARFSSTNDNLLDVIARLYCKVCRIFRSLKPKPTRTNVPKNPVLKEDVEMVNLLFLDEETL